jgi:hypothetical protein
VGPSWRKAIDGVVPPLEMRIFTKFAPNASRVPRDVPSDGAVPARLAARLLWTALAIRLAQR